MYVGGMVTVLWCECGELGGVDSLLPPKCGFVGWNSDCQMYVNWWQVLFLTYPAIKQLLCKNTCFWDLTKQKALFTNMRSLFHDMVPLDFGMTVLRVTMADPWCQLFGNSVVALDIPTDEKFLPGVKCCRTAFSDWILVHFSGRLFPTTKVLLFAPSLTMNWIVQLCSETSLFILKSLSLSLLL